MSEVTNNEISIQPNNQPKEFTMYKLSMTVDKTLQSDFVVDSIDKAIYLINDYLSDSPNEMMIAIALDYDRKPIGCSVIGVGDEKSISDIKSNTFRFALTSCADSIVLVHNHPRSATLQMSDADTRELNNVQQVATLLGIRIRDFIIVGNQNHDRAYYSWWEKRIISQYDFINSVNEHGIGDTPTILSKSGDAEYLHTPSFYNSSDSVLRNTVNEKKNRKSKFSIFK